MKVIEFRPVAGFEGLYEISNTGIVKSCRRIVPRGHGYREIKESLIAIKDDSHGYLIVNLWKNNKLYHRKVHRLVAEAFIPNPNNYSDVNHIDENKYNNNASNLEWISHINNINYGTRNKRANISKSKKVGQFDKISNELITTYINAYVAEEKTGICETNISLCCLGKRKSAGGYKWNFIK